MDIDEEIYERKLARLLQKARQCGLLKHHNGLNFIDKYPGKNTHVKCKKSKRIYGGNNGVNYWIHFKDGTYIYFNYSKDYSTRVTFS